jgi:cytochrome c biogenesis protein CcmG, thiol:disulfide interchange protein DsbE
VTGALHRRPARAGRGEGRCHGSPLKLRIVISFAVASLSILFATSSVRPARAEPGGAVQLGEPAPAIDLDDLAGNRVSLGRASPFPGSSPSPSPGPAVVIQFFATWCEPCHRAWEDLLAVRSEPRSSASPKPRVVLIDLGESRDVVARWVSEAKLDDTVTVALDRNATAAARWGASRLPTIFVVDAQGIVRHINRGWGEGYKARLRRWLSGTPPRTDADRGVVH